MSAVNKLNSKIFSYTPQKCTRNVALVTTIALIAAAVIGKLAWPNRASISLFITSPKDWRSWESVSLFVKSPAAWSMHKAIINKDFEKISALADKSDDIQALMNTEIRQGWCLKQELERNVIEDQPNIMLLAKNPMAWSMHKAIINKDFEKISALADKSDDIQALMNTEIRQGYCLKQDLGWEVSGDGLVFEEKQKFLDLVRSINSLNLLACPLKGTESTLVELLDSAIQDQQDVDSQLALGLLEALFGKSGYIKIVNPATLMSKAIKGKKQLLSLANQSQNASGFRAYDELIDLLIDKCNCNLIFLPQLDDIEKSPWIDALDAGPIVMLKIISKVKDKDPKALNIYIYDSNTCGMKELRELVQDKRDRLADGPIKRRWDESLNILKGIPIN